MNPYSVLHLITPNREASFPWILSWIARNDYVSAWHVEIHVSRDAIRNRLGTKMTDQIRVKNNEILHFAPSQGHVSHFSWHVVISSLFFYEACFNVNLLPQSPYLVAHNVRSNRQISLEIYHMIASLVWNEFRGHVQKFLGFFIRANIIFRNRCVVGDGCGTDIWI